MVDKIKQITKHILLKYPDIDPIDKIRGIKSFILPLAETFAQILPISYLRKINDSILRSYALACNIHPKHVDLNQFSLWSGIPAPIDRWEFLSFSFFLKLLHNFNKPTLHKWVNYYWQTEDLPYFTEITKLCKKFFLFYVSGR